MHLQRSCSCSEEACIETDRFSIAYLEHNEPPRQMHTHNWLEVYFCLSGGRHFVMDDAVFPLYDNDLFIINQFEPHRSEPAPGQVHQRYVLSIMPHFLSGISSAETDLLACFYDRGEHARRLSLTAGQKGRLMDMIQRLTSTQGYGADLLESAILTEIILYVAKLSRSPEAGACVPGGGRIADILNHIDQALDQDLSLEGIAGAFFISKGYLCRMFKEETGTTVNRYVLAKRISRAKQLLSAGLSVQDTIVKTGFNDYANFIRRFKTEVGVTPKQYATQCRNGGDPRTSGSWPPEARASS